ncbi:galectin-5-like isoform X1 [Clavelina lepadiformis]|uniref:galectin-5-like isoform X1 n=1 Tax=Clavelina lepadiformis TaxID=159417 RepID=UPI0040413A30
MSHPTDPTKIVLKFFNKIFQVDSMKQRLSPDTCASLNIAIYPTTPKGKGSSRSTFSCKHNRRVFSGSHRFEINFKTDTDIALIFKSRFDLNRLEFLTYIDGQFKHFDFRALPFAHNKYFKLKFYIDKNAFHVFLDDRHLADYNHRYRPISDIRKMLIYNSVSINRIWME